MELRPQLQRERIQLICNKETGEYLNYRQLLRDPKHKTIWNTSSANEFGRLAQGVGGRVNPTNTIFFIPYHQVPINRRKDVTYGSFSCNMKPNKMETHRTRLTSGRQNKLPRRCRHANSRHDFDQDPFQQRYLNRRRKMCNA